MNRWGIPSCLKKKFVSETKPAPTATSRWLRRDPRVARGELSQLGSTSLMTQPSSLARIDIFWGINGIRIG